MGLFSFFKNLLGNTKNSNKNQIKQIENSNEQTGEVGNIYMEKVETFVEESYTKAKKTSEPFIEDAVEYANQAKDIISQYVEKATDSMNDIIDSVKELANENNTSQHIIYHTVVDNSEKSVTETDE